MFCHIEVKFILGPFTQYLGSSVIVCLGHKCNMTLGTSQKTGWAPGYALKERNLLTRFSHPWYVRGFGSRIPEDAEICRCSNPLYKMA